MPDHVPTVTEVVVAYLEHAKRYYGDAKRGEYANMRNALRPLRRLYGRTPAREFGPQRVKAVREALIESGNARRYVT